MKYHIVSIIYFPENVKSWDWKLKSFGWVDFNCVSFDWEEKLQKLFPDPNHLIENISYGEKDDEDDDDCDVKRDKKHSLNSPFDWSHGTDRSQRALSWW